MVGGRRIPGKNNFCGRNWCVYDACGIVCGLFTWLLLSYGQFCILAIMMTSFEDNKIHQSINFLIFEILFVLSGAAHLKTMFTDPGAVPKGTLTEEYIAQLEKEQQFNGTVLYKCTKCSSIKPERAHHCSVCKRCIRRMDHHCPWVNNCVGENNQFYISLLSCHTLYWAIRQFVWCVGSDWKPCSVFSPPATTILLIFLLFESVLFSIFTAVMFGTQISAICSDQTGIENIKQERNWNNNVRRNLKTNEDIENCDNNNNKSSPAWKNLQVVFGGGGGQKFSFKWLNPFDVPFHSEKAFEFSV